MLRISAHTLAFLLAFLLPLPLTRSLALPAPINHAVIEPGSSASGRNFPATTSSGPTLRIAPAVDMIYVPLKLSSVTLHIRESSFKANGNIADPIIIGLSICVVIAAGITFVYFRQRALARRAAAAEAVTGVADTTEHAVSLHSVHEHQLVASTSGHERRSDSDPTITEGGSDSQPK
ncbi:hypothetical protein B0H12DRAFT_1120932 [Mycena haematopus]|nr:hypothetical protein B0H12DRAFT_1120932 [Mycena haematopus]